MRRSGKAWERRQRRLQYSKELIERAFEARAKKVPVQRYLFDDPRIKKLVQRRDRILRAQRTRRAHHRRTR